LQVWVFGFFEFHVKLLAVCIEIKFGDAEQKTRQMKKLILKDYPTLGHMILRHRDFETKEC